MSWWAVDVPLHLQTILYKSTHQDQTDMLYSNNNIIHYLTHQNQPLKMLLLHFELACHVRW